MGLYDMGVRRGWKCVGEGFVPECFQVVSVRFRVGGQDVWAVTQARGRHGGVRR